MPRPRRVSDEQILQAARSCFFEGGPLTPLSAVAARLGISQAALLHRVGTRE
ncbi:MAG: TetR family transcriptional regulator [Pseudomonadota bacterium]